MGLHRFEPIHIRGAFVIDEIIINDLSEFIKVFNRRMLGLRNLPRCPKVIEFR